MLRCSVAIVATFIIALAMSGHALAATITVDALPLLGDPSSSYMEIDYSLSSDRLSINGVEADSTPVGCDAVARGFECDFGVLDSITINESALNDFLSLYVRSTANHPEVVALPIVYASLGGGNDSIEAAQIPDGSVIDAGAESDGVQAIGTRGLRMLLDNLANDGDGSSNLMNFENLVAGPGPDVILFPYTSGSQEIFGGAGDDTLYCNTGGDCLVEGGEGNDQIHCDLTAKCYAQGEGGNDQINGSVYGDVLTGGNGNDTVLGNGGSDKLVAGGASNGADIYSGGSGSDTIFWSDDVSLNGKRSLPLVIVIDALANDGAAGEHDTVLYNIETHSLGNGSDRFVAPAGSTRGYQVWGRDGYDTLIGGGGADDFSGMAGVDALYGRGGRDHLAGGARADLMIGGRGRDVFYGEGGADRIRARDGQRDIISCFNLLAKDLRIQRDKKDRFVPDCLKRPK